uniref:Secreted protein n=1 Tax=Mycena chlorophos TaxID=658473 RepID=A0ABQ0LKH4_MYCCL|nr:predicted protein [Mycena chlorophos]
MRVRPLWFVVLWVCGERDAGGEEGKVWKRETGRSWYLAAHNVKRPHSLFASICSSVQKARSYTDAEATTTLRTFARGSPRPTARSPSVDRSSKKGPQVKCSSVQLDRRWKTHSSSVICTHTPIFSKIAYRCAKVTVAASFLRSREALAYATTKHTVIPHPHP